MSANEDSLGRLERRGFFARWILLARVENGSGIDQRDCVAWLGYRDSDSRSGWDILLQHFTRHWVDSKAGDTAYKSWVKIQCCRMQDPAVP